MALKIPFPTSQEIYLKLVFNNEEDKRGRLVMTDNPDEAAAKVTFRQGTNEDDAAHNRLLFKRKYAMNNEGTVEEIADVSPDDVIRQDVQMTLIDTDIELPNGKSLEFTDVAGVMRVNKEQFHQWWALLPSGWVAGIYRACIKVNPDWSSKSMQ